MFLKFLNAGSNILHFDAANLSFQYDLGESKNILLGALGLGWSYRFDFNGGWFLDWTFIRGTTQWFGYHSGDRWKDKGIMDRGVMIDLPTRFCVGKFINESTSYYGIINPCAIGNFSTYMGLLNYIHWHPFGFELGFGLSKRIHRLWAFVGEVLFFKRWSQDMVGEVKICVGLDLSKNHKNYYKQPVKNLS